LERKNYSSCSCPAASLGAAKQDAHMAGSASLPMILLSRWKLSSDYHFTELNQAFSGHCPKIIYFSDFLPSAPTQESFALPVRFFQV
jgi:hypothetical protein